MISKAIIVLNNLGKGALPLGVAVAPEFWLLHGASLIEHLVAEASEAGIQEITIIGSSEQKSVIDYLKKIMLEEKSVFGGEDIDFNFVIYSENLASTLLKIRNKTEEGSVAILLAHHFMASIENPFLQMGRITNTANRTVVGLVDHFSGLSGWGARLEKIADRIYKVKEIIPVEESSCFLIGRIIANSEFWECLQEMKKEGQLGSGRIEEVIGFMTDAGKDVYAFELKGACCDLNEKESWKEINKFLVEKDYGEGLH
jgi:UTP-glucose-1-phosphate uridylyltransferase